MRLSILIYVSFANKLALLSVAVLLGKAYRDLAPQPHPLNKTNPL